MGAFAGENSGEISNSYTRGSLKYDPLTSVIDEEGWDTIIYSGGFLGYNTGSIVNCYSTSGIDWLWYDPLDFSGFVSYNDGNVLNCYWDIESSAADSSAAGYGRLTIDMNHPHSDSTYVGWDFDEIWFADTQGLINDGYPLLRWQFQQPFAEFSASITEGFAPLTVDFFDHSLPGSGGDIQWLWDFGDGETSVLQNPTHVYNDAGVYSVSLQVTDAYGTQALTELPDLIHALQASPMISLLSANSASFGSVFVEESSPYLPVVIGSIGGAEVTISDVHFVSESSHFELMNLFRNIIVAHGESDTLWVRFSPHTVGALGDTLYIVNNSLNEPLLKVRLTGNGMHVLPASPQITSISVEGNNVQLTWDDVTMNMHGNSITPDYYFVYIATNPYGQFSLMTICNSPNVTHPFVVIGAERMFL
jgi:PKD repeat protein